MTTLDLNTFLAQRPVLRVGSTRVVRINAKDFLDEGASLSGTVNVEEVGTVTVDEDADTVTTVTAGTSDLTIDNESIVDADTTYTDDVTDEEVGAGQGCFFRVSGGVTDTTYHLKITVSTDSNPRETFVFPILLTWE